LPNGKGSEDQEEDLETKVAKLDIFLVYLWRVHGVDYYGGKELCDPADYEGHTNSRRTVRGPRPEEGEQATDEEGDFSHSSWDVVADRHIPLKDGPCSLRQLAWKGVRGSRHKVYFALRGGCSLRPGVKLRWQKQRWRLLEFTFENKPPHLF
jgi:hypothetical protein